MARVNHQQNQNRRRFLHNFLYPQLSPNQQKTLKIIGREMRKMGPVLLEMPTGLGMTAIGYTCLKQLLKGGH